MGGMQICVVALLLVVGSVAQNSTDTSNAIANIVPFVTSLTMCLSRISLQTAEYSFSMRQPFLRNRIQSRNKRQVRCPDSGLMFRTVDGECNNIKNPDLGRSFEKLKRYLPPMYHDGISIPRIQGTCRKDLLRVGCIRSMLPSPRVVSTVIHKPNSITSFNSIMLMQWGQFLDHDLTAAAIEQPTTATPCCAEARARAGYYHQDTFKKAGKCFPLSILQTTPDRFFQTKCMEFIRSRSINPVMNRKNPREQQNIITSFIDASNVYGSDMETQLDLRDVNGRMKTSNNGKLLKRGRDGDCIRNNAPYCFAAGDERVHVFPGLTALHTLFVRLHNEIVEELDQNTDWDGERLFQETRKIVGALLQKVTYEEFLPEVLPKKIIDLYRLQTGTYKYDDRIDPSIANVFATAAYRFGHSLIPNFLVIKNEKIKSRELFNNPQYIFWDIKSVLQNILSNPAELTDRFLSIEITDHLFELHHISFDLAALNIQRGRDHGLPSYNYFRRFCGLRRVESFYSSELGTAGRDLHMIYNDIEEVDIFTGGMVESPLPGSAVGPTFACIIGRQFEDLKFGDSFWYETKDSKRGFSPDQLAAIKKVTLSQLLCHQFDMEKIQKNPFRVVSSDNPLVYCNSLSTLDLTPWYNNEE